MRILGRIGLALVSLVVIGLLSAVPYIYLMPMNTEAPKVARMLLERQVLSQRVPDDENGWHDVSRVADWDADPPGAAAQRAALAEFYEARLSEEREAEEVEGSLADIRRTDEERKQQLEQFVPGRNGKDCASEDVEEDATERPPVFDGPALAEWLSRTQPAAFRDEKERLLSVVAFDPDAFLAMAGKPAFSAACTGQWLDQLEAGRFFDAEFPNARSLFQVASLSDIYADTAASDRSALIRRALLDIGERLSGDPMLIAMMVGEAIRRIAMDGLINDIAWAEIGSDPLAMLDVPVQGPETAEAFREAVIIAETLPMAAELAQLAVSPDETVVEVVRRFARALDFVPGFLLAEFGRRTLSNEVAGILANALRSSQNSDLANAVPADWPDGPSQWMVSMGYPQLLRFWRTLEFGHVVRGVASAMATWRRDGLIVPGQRFDNFGSVDGMTAEACPQASPTQPEAIDVQELRRRYGIVPSPYPRVADGSGLPINPLTGCPVRVVVEPDRIRIWFEPGTVRETLPNDEWLIYDTQAPSMDPSWDGHFQAATYVSW